MIAAFNRKQTLLAIGNFVVGAVAAVLAYVFFRYATLMILESFSVRFDPALPGWIGVAGLVIVVVAGIFEYRRGGGQSEYHETDLFPGFDLSTGSGYWANYRVQQVTAPAYILSQIFLAAPLQLIRGIERLRSRLPESGDLEQRLRALLDVVNANPAWHPLRTYANHAEEIGDLIRMELVQFSPRKGSVRRL